MGPVNAAEMLKELEHLSLQERLSELCLFSLEETQLRGTSALILSLSVCRERSQ